MRDLPDPRPVRAAPADQLIEQSLILREHSRTLREESRRLRDHFRELRARTGRSARLPSPRQ
jgi:hypothetical protein